MVDIYAIHAVTGPAMVPILTHASGNDPVTTSVPRRRGKAFSIHPENRL